jgi:hypothetical protein
MLLCTILQWLEEPQLMNYILFTDDTQFHYDVPPTQKKTSDNPHEVILSNFQHRFSVNTWCRTGGSHLYGPNFIKGSMTAAPNRHFLELQLQFHLGSVLQTR